MARAAVYLYLAPEFGGTTFGPFAGMEIRLGSDPGKNDIVLPEALGVLPEHLKLIRQTDEAFILAPVTRTATVFLFRGGAAPKQVTTPTAAAANDAFSVVTAEGPRFYIVVQQPQQAAGTAGAAPVGPSKKKKQDLPEGIMAELKRIGLAKFFTSKVGNFFQTAWRMVKTGAIFSPRYIVAGMFMIVPMIMAGGLGCAFLGMLTKSRAQSEELEEVKGDLAACAGTDTEADPSIPSLVKSILKDNEWEQSLVDDPELLKEFVTQLKKVFESGEKYAWVYKRKASDFVTVKSHFERQLGPAVGGVFSYTAAYPAFVQGREWTLLKENTDGERVCQRGPVPITYRQGVNLEMNVRPDALVETALAESDDTEAKGEAIKRTIGSDPVAFELEEIEVAGVALQGGFVCMFLTGEDDRDDAKDVAAALKKALGPTAAGVPSEGDDYWISARLAKFFAADMAIGFSDLQFTARPSTVLDEARSSEKVFAMTNTAETIARAVAIPCLAKLSKEEAGHMGELPSLMQCGVLRLMIDYDLGT